MHLVHTKLIRNNNDTTGCNINVIPSGHYVKGTTNIKGELAKSPENRTTIRDVISKDAAKTLQLKSIRNEMRNLITANGAKKQ